MALSLIVFLLQNVVQLIVKEYSAFKILFVVGLEGKEGLLSQDGNIQRMADGR